MSRRRNLMYTVLLCLVIAVFVFAGYVRMLEQRNLYAPSRGPYQTQGETGLDLTAIDLVSAGDVRLAAFYVPSLYKGKVIYFLHGNGGNIGGAGRLEKMKFFHDLGWPVFAVDYRGYGTSTGVPSEKGLYEDAVSGYTYLVETMGIRPEEIVVYGESLGAAVAIELACRVPVGGLVLEGAFTSVADMGKLRYSFIPSFLVSQKYDSIKKVSCLRAPVLMMHSRDDIVVPFGMGQRLFEAIRSDKRFVATNGGHSDHFGLNEQRLRPIFKEYLAKF